MRRKTTIKQMLDALKVIALTPEIREHLERTDPQALRQVNEAIERTEAEMEENRKATVAKFHELARKMRS